LAVAGCESSQPQATAPIAPPQKPLVVLFGTDAAATLAGSVMDDDLVPALRAEGYELFSMNLPCHDGGPINLALVCWRTSIEGGDTDLFTRFCRALSAEINRLSITSAIAIGQSRGGYVATTCAAYDFRFSKVVLLKPVTDLQNLHEFNGYTVNQSLFGLAQFAPALLGRPVSILIGANDTRVNTASAVRFGISVGAEIELTDSSDHLLPGDGFTSRWVLDRL
jgi:pimeloyl-ACP methyl ester carboxylesterase